MKGRIFKAKRGHYIKEKKVKSALRNIFGEFEEKNDYYLIEKYKAFDEMEIEIIKNKNKKNKLRVYSDASMERANKVPETKKDLNKFLEKTTGYTAKERRDKMKKKVED